MRRLTMLLMLLCATAAVGACSDDEPADRPPASGAKEKPVTLTKCLEDSGLEVERRDGNVIRAKDPESSATADITTFPSGAEASEFANQLDEPGTQAGRRVAVYSSSDSNSTTTDVNACLSMAG